MFSLANHDYAAPRVERASDDGGARKKQRTLDNGASIESVPSEQEIGGKRRFGNAVESNGNETRESAALNTTTQSLTRILERRYLLTKTGYKYLDIGIVVKTPSSYVNILLGDSHGKYIAFSPETWKSLLEQQRQIVSLLRRIECEDMPPHSPSRIYIGNLTIRFSKLNNSAIMRFETATERISLSRSSAQNLFNLQHCVNRLIHSLTAITASVDAKLSRLIAIASNEKQDPAKLLSEHETFDRNDIIECELVALYFGSY